MRLYDDQPVILRGFLTLLDSDQDLLKLIERTEEIGDEEDKPKEGMNFSFAKVWAADKDQLEEIEYKDQVDSWTQALEKLQGDQLKTAIQVEATSGRGSRKAAAAAKVGI